MGLWATALATVSPSPPSSRGPSIPTDPKFQLPTELWIMILDCIVDEVRRPYLYCLPGTYPHYQSRLFNIENRTADYVTETWKNARAVCRAWKVLVGPSPLPYTLSVGLSDPGRSLKDISTIFVKNMEEFAPLISRFVKGPSSITTLTLGGGLWSTPAAIDLLLDNYLVFPELACLSISRTSTNSNRPFWQRLQDGFPQLISLTIRQNSNDEFGTFLFPKLRFLDMHAWKNFQLQCPSLRHLSVQNDCPQNVDEFLSHHGHQLQSLFLEWSDSQTFSSQPNLFWNTCPNVTTFGTHCSLYGLRTPPDHPLRHLRLFTNPYTKSDTILPALDVFPNITHLYITQQGLKDISVIELSFILSGRGVRLVEVAGAEGTITSPQNVPWDRPESLKLQSSSQTSTTCRFNSQPSSGKASRWKSLWALFSLSQKASS
ncbi:hypothetical protein FS842_011269 [Serendipita sp. 407]|nr:hypothetical protein FRC16_000561 [Serendipita sp. 398]KAG8855980.1 hypothetical protein FRC20_000633 [Serendipita sp. 405]KAG9050954.1 hypothetical protein FS842_011269 [Serendipita sp. 407]